jgi:hypothetical protein
MTVSWLLYYFTTLYQVLRLCFAHCDMMVVSGDWEGCGRRWSQRVLRQYSDTALKGP